MPAPTSEPSATRTPRARCEPEREQPAAQRGVAVGQCATATPRAAEQPQLASGRVHVVGEHAARPEQPVLVVARRVVAAEQLPHALDLLGVLVEVRGEPERPGTSRSSAAGRLQQRVGAGQREARRDGVPGAALAVPALARASEPLVVGALGRGEQVLAQDPVGQHQPAGHPQPDPGRPRRTARPPRPRSASRRPARWWCRPARGRRRSRRRPRRRTSRRRAAPPRAARTSRASRAAACRGRRSRGPAGSARGCRRTRAAPAPRAGRRPRRPGARAGAVERAAGDDHAVLRRASASVRLGAQVAAGEGAAAGCRGRCRGRRVTAGAARSRARRPPSSSAATDDRDGGGLLAGGHPGQADRRVDPVDDVLGVPVAEQLGPEPRPLGRRADQPDRAEVVAAAARRRRARGPRRGRGSSPARGCPAAARPSTSSGSTGTWWTCTAATASASGASASASRCSGRESTRCRSRSWRARIRASSRPTWPTPKIATDGTTGSGSSSTVTSPPQHCTPCWSGALSERCAVERLGRGRRRMRAAPARGVRPPPRGCRRRSSAQVDVARDDHLGAGLARRVAADVGHRDEHAGLAGGAQRRPPPATTWSCRGLPRPGAVERPVDRLGRRRRGELDARRRAARTPHTPRAAPRGR